MNTDAPMAGGYLVGVVAAVDMDANQTIQTRSGRRSIRGAVAFAGGSGVECRICGAREWLLVPTLGTSPMEQEAIDESNGRPGHVCIGASAANYVRAAREAAARGEMERAEHMAAHAVIEAEAIGPAAAREALARLI